MVIANTNNFLLITEQAWLVLLVGMHLKLVNHVHVEVTFAVLVVIIAVLKICFLGLDGILNHYKVIVKEVLAAGGEEVDFVLVLNLVAHRCVSLEIRFVLFLPNNRIQVARVLNQFGRLLAEQGFLGGVAAAESFASRIYWASVSWEFALVD